ncbi:MAG: hopanoid-associated sugar epimerase [Candidatus Atelocyanobacterium thalassa isolate SIO64986]|uniref:Hopanoid-associated sugar epimerase n=1 Tax=Candidatus Atelocyanobacterium thalassa isolate SIO64986 TaxID=1527444 RepID=A0A086CGN9_9CHRO|nr:MAG: hopanoid-associated sugar epimerase [Candidatus Atelocyanobacterium thalassa isolate SIO64986]
MAIKVFVTGGTGFVGANLVRLLIQKNYQVRVLARNYSNLNNLKNLDVDIVFGDLNDTNLAEKMRGYKILFHVAAYYSLYQIDKNQLYNSNVLGTRSILKAAKQANVERIIYTSSVAAIGVKETGEIVNENYQAPVDKIIGHYKKSKYWAEQEVYRAIKDGQDIVLLNPSTPIGPFDIKPTPTGEIILRFLRRKMPAYVNTGLNLIDVRDVAHGHILALEKGKTGQRYILGNKNLSLKALLDELSLLTGLRAPERTLPIWLPLTFAWMEEYVLSPLGKKPGIPLDGVRMSKKPMYYDSSKAINELNISYRPIRDSLQDAIDWFVNNGYI